MQKIAVIRDANPGSLALEPELAEAVRNVIENACHRRIAVGGRWLAARTHAARAARSTVEREQPERGPRGARFGARRLKGWRDRRPANAPDLTVLQRAFLACSEDEETARTSAERNASQRSRPRRRRKLRR